MYVTPYCNLRLALPSLWEPGIHRIESGLDCKVGVLRLSTTSKVNEIIVAPVAGKHALKRTDGDKASQDNEQIAWHAVQYMYPVREPPSGRRPTTTNTVYDQ
jgi:hypothetical protein